MRFLHALLMSRGLGPKIIMIKEMVRLLQFCFSNGSCFVFVINSKIQRGHSGRHLMVVGFITTCAISAYHH